MRIDVTFKLKPEAHETLEQYQWLAAQLQADMHAWNANNPIPWVMRFVLEGGKSPDFSLPPSLSSAPGDTLASAPDPAAPLSTP